MVKRLLVVEDNEDILEALEIAFTSSGYAVETVKDGKTAYAAVEKFRPDIIILDMLLSGVNGLTLCNSLKMNDETKHIPIVMISAHPRAKQLTLAAGADHFVPKPFELDDLISLVERILAPSSSAGVGEPPPLT